MRLPRWVALLVLLSLFAAACTHVLIRFRTQSGPDRAENSFIVGEVRNDQGAVSGARVRWQGSPESILTDADGRFRLQKVGGDATRITAWKEGHFIAGAPAATSPLSIWLTRLPGKDSEVYTWVDSPPDPAKRDNCGNCHAEIHREWSASGHARSASNRHFLNLYDGSDWNGRRKVGWNFLAEYPDGAGVCTACHAPTVAFNDSAYYDLRLARGTSAQGVHCDYCHKIADVANEQIGLTHGRFGLKLLRPAEGQLFFGPLDDVDRGEDAFSPLYRESRYCASCHEGTIFGVHVYSTYSEWLQSSARNEGKQCQSCHMAPTGTMTSIAPGKGGIGRDPSTLANHRFFAGSQAEMLRKCLSLTVGVRPRQASIQVETMLRADHVGHRVPTGFADRNLLLVVEAFGKEGHAVTPRTGPTLPAIAGNSVVGLTGRLYAKQLSNFEGNSPVPFWRARPELIDSRLAAGQGDAAIYEFPPGIDHVRVRLMYRRFWEDVAKVKDWREYEIALVDQSITVKLGKEVRWTGP